MAGINDNLRYDGGLGYDASKANTRYNQFNGIADYEPTGIEHGAFDNPEFLWPKKEYMDIAGQTHKVQRGYMRSLITDPRWSANPSVGNRRLFFQFNPQVIVRTVQQTVGAMSPLLQSPEQLLQPVPGTSSFGFELLFNREHEVAAGSSGLGTDTGDWITLPNGSTALPSQVGVLADILVLDSITGQGISRDMIDFVTQQSTRILEAQEKSLENQKDAEAEKTYITDLKKGVSSLDEQYNLNIGNQAFLNPLPFRVLFSSLFMVEGVATSVDVQFHKFSRTMVPTQCKVTINMYALYIGFAQKDTFLTKNLETSRAEKFQETITNDAIKTKLNYAFQSMNISAIQTSLDITGGNLGKALVFQFFDTKKTEEFKKQLKTKELSDVKIRGVMKYVFQASESATVSNNSYLTESATLTGQQEPGSSYISIEGGTLRSYEFTEATMKERSSPSPMREYISFQLQLQVVSGDVVSDTIFFPIVDGFRWFYSDYIDTPELSWTNSRQYVTPPAPSRGARRR